jgi:hypothetical protein
MLTLIFGSEMHFFVLFLGEKCIFSSISAACKLGSDRYGTQTFFANEKFIATAVGYKIFFACEKLAMKVIVGRQNIFVIDRYRLGWVGQ